MKVYDGFLFFNELDLLEIRLNELRDVVDYFVLVESPISHSGKEKPLYYWQNRQRFSAFPIIHIVQTDIPETPDYWAAMRHPQNPMDWTRENHQRDCIIRGLSEAEPDDMVMLSDLDEIPRASSVLLAKERLRAGAPFLIFEQRHCYYYIDLVGEENHGMLVTRATLRRNFHKPMELRWMLTGEVLQKAGWHFSWLGGTDKIIEKLENFSHQELNNPTLKDPSFIESCLHTGKTIHSMKKLTRVPIDETYPIWLRENLERFRQFVTPEGLREFFGP